MASTASKKITSPVGAEASGRSDGAEIKRRQLFELHDLPWWPVCLRQSLTDVLILAWGFPWITFKRQGARAVPSLASLCARVIARVLPHPNGDLESNRERIPPTIVDLCSGSGGPWNEICAELRRSDLCVYLTDLYPPVANISAKDSPNGNGSLHYYRASVDATNVPKELRGMRTLFGGFHHFPPEVARAVLQDAVDSREPIVIIESCDRTLSQMIGAGLLMAPLALLTPLIYFRRTPWRTFVFTYLIPITPLTSCFDGVVSCMRAYEPNEMLAVAQSVEGWERYRWTVGKESFFKLFTLTYMIAQPRQEVSTAAAIT